MLIFGDTQEPVKHTTSCLRAIDLLDETKIHLSTRLTLNIRCLSSYFCVSMAVSESGVVLSA